VQKLYKSTGFDSIDKRTKAFKLNDLGKQDNEHPVSYRTWGSTVSSPVGVRGIYSISWQQIPNILGGLNQLAPSPLNMALWGSAVSSSSGILGGALATNAFWHCCSQKHLMATDLQHFWVCF